MSEQMNKKFNLEVRQIKKIGVIINSIKKTK